jgi:hypothetical protein
MAAILNLLLMPMSGIDGDCINVLFTSENVGLSFGLVPISKVLAKLQVFPFFQFSCRHLGFSTDIDVAHYRWLRH